MVTVSEFITRLQRIIDDYTELKNKLSVDDTNSYLGNSKIYKSQVRKLKQQANEYDREFEEEQSKVSALGGKTRKQTLQEFVLLFFFISYCLFVIAFATYTSVKEGGGAGKILAIGVLGLGFIVGFLIRYA